MDKEFKKCTCNACGDYAKPVGQDFREERGGVMDYRILLCQTCYGISEVPYWFHPGEKLEELKTINVE